MAAKLVVTYYDRDEVESEGAEAELKARGEALHADADVAPLIESIRVECDDGRIEFLVDDNTLFWE